MPDRDRLVALVHAARERRPWHMMFGCPAFDLSGKWFSGELLGEKSTPDEPHYQCERLVLKCTGDLERQYRDVSGDVLGDWKAELISFDDAVELFIDTRNYTYGLDLMAKKEPPEVIVPYVNVTGKVISIPGPTTCDRTVWCRTCGWFKDVSSEVEPGDEPRHSQEDCKTGQKAQQERWKAAGQE